MPAFLRNSSRRTTSLVVAATGLLLLLSGCRSANPGGGSLHLPGSHSPLEVLPAPGSLLDREDLRHLVERQARRDTAFLITSLRHDDPVVRARAALALGSVRAASAAPALVGALGDADPQVRAFAAFALGKSGGVELTGPLLDALQEDTDLTVRRQLLDALGRTGDRAALAAVATMRLPQELEAQRALSIARFGIRQVFDPGATALVAGLLRHQQGDIRTNAAYFFGRITDAGVWADHQSTVADAARALALDDAAQLFLASALGRSTYPDREELLSRLLAESPDWRIRTSAARALGSVAPAAAPILIRALDDGSHHVSAAAGASLGMMEGIGDDALGVLERWMRENPHRWESWAALLPVLVRGSRDGAVLFALDTAAVAAGPFARAATARALERTTSAMLLARLVDSGADADVRVANAALTTLAARWRRDRTDRFADLLYPVFTSAVQRADVATVSAAAPVLADSLFIVRGSGDVMREAYASMEVPRDIEPMAAIIRAHGVLRDQPALDFLIDVALNGPHPSLRYAATDALDTRFEGVEFEPTGLRPPAFPRLDVRRLERLGSRPRLILETARGEVVLELAPDWAPLTTLTIIHFAESRKYDGVPFHRIVPNFVAQGGDFARQDGFGGPEFFLPSEFTPVPYRTGTLGMASSGPDTEGSQFFITHSMQPHLDANYTVFGRVVAGQEVVDALRIGDRILRARVEPGR